MSHPEIDKDLEAEHFEGQISEEEAGKLAAVPIPERIKQQHADLYYEALEKYGHEGSIDPLVEKRLKR